jgi:hypothetical protein
LLELTVQMELMAWSNWSHEEIKVKLVLLDLTGANGPTDDGN